MSSPIETLKKLNGIKLPNRKTTVTVTHLFAFEEIEVEVTFGDISAVTVMVPLFFKHGMIHNYQGQRRWFSPDKLIRVAWFNPILDEQIEIYNPFRDEEYIDYVLSN